MSNPPIAKKNNPAMLIIGASVGVLFCICCVALALSYGSSGSTDTDVKYVISGTATSAMITYTNETGGTEQVNVNLPFTKEFKASPGAALSIVAQNNGSGSITCEIWINGELKKTSTSTAQYGVVTCSDFLF